jgi:hypothetical protein
MDMDRRLTASYPLLTMLSTAACGWLMAVQLRAAERDADGDPLFLEMKKAAASFYLEQIVPEATGLIAAATAPADVRAVSDAALGC